MLESGLLSSCRYLDVDFDVEARCVQRQSLQCKSSNTIKQQQLHTTGFFSISGQALVRTCSAFNSMASQPSMMHAILMLSSFKVNMATYQPLQLQACLGTSNLWEPGQHFESINSNNMEKER